MCADFLDSVFEIESEFARAGAEAGERDGRLRAQAEALVLVRARLFTARWCPVRVCSFSDVFALSLRRAFKKERIWAAIWDSAKDLHWPFKHCMPAATRRGATHSLLHCLSLGYFSSAS